MITGRPAWHETDSYDWANDLAVDNQGNVVVVGTQQDGDASRPIVMRWDTHGVPCPGWGTVAQPAVRTLGGASPNTGLGWTVAVDGDRNVVVGGSIAVQHSTGLVDDDFAVMKWDPLGNPFWTANGLPAPRLLNGTAPNSDDRAQDIAVTPEGDIIATGCLEQAGTGPDLAVMKWYANGTPGQGWRNTVFNWIPRPLIVPGAGAGAVETGNCVKVDSQSNIFVSGEFRTTFILDDHDFTVMKVRWDGTLLWQRSIDGGAHALDGVNALALDAFGNLYAAGYLNSIPFGGSSSAVISFDTQGTERARTLLTGTRPDGRNSAFALTFDSSGWPVSAGSVENQVTSNLFGNTAGIDSAAYF